MLHVTCAITHPNGVVERISSDDIAKLYDMSVAEYQAFVATEPPDDNGRMLEERRAAVAESREMAAIRAISPKRNQPRATRSKQVSKKPAPGGDTNGPKSGNQPKRSRQSQGEGARKGRAAAHGTKPKGAESGLKAERKQNGAGGTVKAKRKPKPKKSKRLTGAGAPVSVCKHKPEEKSVGVTKESVSLFGGIRSSGIRSKTSYNETPVTKELSAEERRKKWQKPQLDTSRMSGSSASRHSAASSYKDPSDYSPFDSFY